MRSPFSLPLVLLLGAALSVPRASAQQQVAPEALKIIGISVEGNVLSDAAAVIAGSGLKVGDEIRVPGDQVNQAIHRLWSLKIFDDVQIGVDRRVEDGIFMLITVRELPRYEGIEIRGNDEISTDDLMKKVPFVRGQVVSPNDLRRLEKQLLRAYEEKGFKLATVEVKSVPSDTSDRRVTVIIDIQEGTEVVIQSVSFEGNVAFDDGTLEGELEETKPAPWWNVFSSPNYDRKKFEEDKRKLIRFYQRNGYRDAEVTGDSIWITEDRTGLHLQITVSEGNLYFIRSVSWDGNTVYSDAMLNARLGLGPGEIYNKEMFEQNLRGNESQTDVASLYLDNGYLTFNLEPVEMRVAPDSVDIVVRVFERNKFRIGQVSVKGNTKTQEKVIRRELQTVPGDYFSRGSIIRSVRQLSVLNYFNPEKIIPDYQLRDDGQTVDLVYSVEEKSSDNVNASIGYSGAFGFTGALGFTINNFSIAEPFTGGAGQILNFEWQFGEGASYRTFSVGFTEPWLFDTPTSMGVSLFDTRQRFNYDLRQTGGSLRVGRRFRWPDIYWRGDWILNGQYNDVLDGRGLYTEGKTTQVSITQILSRNSVDNPVFPTTGTSFSFSTELSGWVLPGDIDFVKFNIGFDWYIRLFGYDRLALTLSTQWGYLEPFEDASLIPPMEQFWMGGVALGYIATTPLRGYEEQSIGVFDEFGRIKGGRVMTKQLAELRWALALNPIPIYLLTFAEAGNVYESLSKADFFTLFNSAGFGARLLINPIGMIGFDYGYGFDDATGPVGIPDGRPDGWRFHFVFGRGF